MFILLNLLIALTEVLECGNWTSVSGFGIFHFTTFSYT